MRHFLIFDNFLSRWNDNLQKNAETCASNSTLASNTTPMFCWRWFLALHYHNDVAKGWTSTVHRQDKHDFSLIMIEFKLVSTHQDGNQLGSLSILPRVRIEKRGSEKPINSTEQLFIERSLTIYQLRIQERRLCRLAIKFWNHYSSKHVTEVQSGIKVEKRKKHVEADQKQQVGDCGTKQWFI